MFSHLLERESEAFITTESPLLPWLVRHCGWTVRADGRTYSRLKGREYTSDISIFGEAIWYKLPKTADLTKLDDRTAIWLIGEWCSFGRISSTEGRKASAGMKER